MKKYIVTSIIALVAVVTGVTFTRQTTNLNFLIMHWLMWKHWLVMNMVETQIVDMTMTIKDAHI